MESPKPNHTTRKTSEDNWDATAEHSTVYTDVHCVYNGIVTKIILALYVYVQEIAAFIRVYYMSAAQDGTEVFF